MSHGLLSFNRKVIGSHFSYVPRWDSLGASVKDARMLGLQEHYMKAPNRLSKPALPWQEKPRWGIPWLETITGFDFQTAQCQQTLAWRRQGGLQVEHRFSRLRDPDVT